MIRAYLFLAIEARCASGYFIVINFGGSKQAARWLDSEWSMKRSWQFRILMVDIRKMTGKLGCEDVW